MTCNSITLRYFVHVEKINNILQIMMSVPLVLITVMPVLYVLLSGASPVHVEPVMMEIELLAMVTLIPKSWRPLRG